MTMTQPAAHWGFLRLFAPIFHGAGACQLRSWIRMWRVNRARYSLFSILWISRGIKNFGIFRKSPLLQWNLTRSLSIDDDACQSWHLYATFWHCIESTMYKWYQSRQTKKNILYLIGIMCKESRNVNSNFKSAVLQQHRVCNEHGRCLRWNAAFKLPNINMYANDILLAWPQLRERVRP